MIWKIESDNKKADIFTKGLQGQIFVSIISCYVVGNSSDEKGCSKKLHLRSYLETLWSKMEYFGLLAIGEESYIVYYPNISYQWMKVYRVAKMDIGRYHWNKGIIGMFLISISTTVLILRDNIL